MGTTFEVLAEFTEGDTSALFDYSANDPDNGNAAIDWSTFSSVKLRARGNKNSASLGTGTAGVVQSPTTKIRFDCAALVALGADVYTCQVAATDGSGVRTGDDFLITVKEKVQ